MSTKRSESDKTEANMLTARSALLDFYSDRAVAFASFFLASIFGLVSTLAIFQGIEGSVFLVLGSLILYWTFAYAGYFTFRRFSFYAGIADRLRGSLEESAKLDEARTFVDLKPEMLALDSEIKTFKGKKYKETNLSTYRDIVLARQEQMLGRHVLKKQKYVSAMYWVLIWVLGVLVYYPATNSKEFVIALALPLLISFSYHKLKASYDGLKARAHAILKKYG